MLTDDGDYYRRQTQIACQNQCDVGFFLDNMLCWYLVLLTIKFGHIVRLVCLSSRDLAQFLVTWICATKLHCTAYQLFVIVYKWFRQESVVGRLLLHRDEFNISRVVFAPLSLSFSLVVLFAAASNFLPAHIICRTRQVVIWAPLVFLFPSLVLLLSLRRSFIM